MRHRATDDWYVNLLRLDRRKCLLIVRAGTLFPVFVADVRISDLRPIGRRIVDLLKLALLESSCPLTLWVSSIRMTSGSRRQRAGPSSAS
jgi:hypothetical protein